MLKSASCYGATDLLSWDSVTHGHAWLASSYSAVALGSSEEHDVRLRSVNCVVDPASRLLNADAPPFILSHELALWHQARDLCIGR